MTTPRGTSGIDPSLRILLVEGEALLLMMTAEMVEELGHRVVAKAGSIE
jgi:CheY-like chemotaxis protein